MIPRAPARLRVSSAPRALVLASLCLCLVDVSPARAQAPRAATSIDEAVAAALHDRAMVLFGRSEFRDARTLLLEALERSPQGPSAEKSRALLAACDERLGLAAPQAGVPGPPGSPPAPAGSAPPAGEPAAPRDPYGGAGSGGDQPRDPYEPRTEPGGPATGAPQPTTDVAPLDPYAGLPAQPDSARPAGVARPAAPARAGARTALLGWSGGYGLLVGLTLAGPQGAGGETRAGAVLLGLLGAGAGVAASHYMSVRHPLRPPQIASLVSAGSWGALAGALFADLASGFDTATNTVYRGAALGGALGLGAGLLLARQTPSGADVALVDSTMLHGTLVGLLSAAAIAPPHSEAYGLQATIGMAAGLGAGALLAPRLELGTRRLLWIDGAALAGAAVPWFLVYPLAARSDTSTDEQAVATLSAVGLGAGIALGWWFSRGLAGSDASRSSAGAAALLERDAAGRWRAGLPAIVPLVAGATPPGRSWGLLLAAGLF